MGPLLLYDRDTDGRRARQPQLLEAGYTRFH